MDTMSIRMQRDRIQNEADSRQQFSVAGAKRQEDTDRKASENGMIRAVEQNQAKSPDFLAERQTADSREELRIKSRALQESERMERRAANAEYERSRGLERSNLLNQRAADVQQERAHLRDMGEAEVSGEKRENLLADADRRIEEIGEERRSAQRVNLANTRRAREERINLLAEPNAQRKLQEENEQKKEEASVQEMARSKENVKVSGQQRMQEEVTRMLDNMRIASDDAKGIQYSSAI